MGEITFEYYNGPVEHMDRLADGQHTCSFCGQLGRCFRLDQRRHGCFECLRQGRFLFDHDTEIGLLTSDGLRHFYNHHQRVPKNFNKAAFRTLLRTPEYVTWQQGIWLTHCDDFMIYLGEWKAKDFHQHSENGDGRSLFLDMTDKVQAFLWDRATPVGAKGPADWYAAYYAFKCRHCGKLRGNWDCP